MRCGVSHTSDSVWSNFKIEKHTYRFVTLIITVIFTGLLIWTISQSLSNGIIYQGADMKYSECPPL